MNQSQIRKFQKRIKNIIKEYGRKVEIHQWTTIDCPDCVFDPVSGESTDPLCGTCSGKGRIRTDNYDEISCIIESLRNRSALFALLRLGEIQQGDIRLICMLDDVLSAPSDTYSETLFEQASKIVVDSKDCVLTNLTRDGIGPLKENLFICIATIRLYEGADDEF